jgi:hypothetical protein
MMYSRYDFWCNDKFYGHLLVIQVPLSNMLLRIIVVAEIG